MHVLREAANPCHAHCPAPTPDLCDRGATDTSVDTRYRDLLQAAEWARLPVTVRRRFSKRLGPGEIRIYAGRVTECRISAVGRVVAMLARLVGGPLPLIATPGPAVVTVTDDPAIGGQVWTRTYMRRGGFPQVIASAKRFGGPTGIDELLGGGIVMRLAMSEDAGDLVFASTRYGIEIAGRFVPVPRWLEPGRCEVRHHDDGAAGFTFTLTLRHPLFGCLVRQVATFRDVHVESGMC